jgi:hypothetical protein
MQKPESYEDFQDRIFQQIRDMEDAERGREGGQLLSEIRKAGFPTASDIEMLKSGKSLQEILKPYVGRIREQAAKKDQDSK